MRICVLPALAACCLGQAGDYAPDKENALFKTVPGKQLFQEDVRCGDYFWKSEKADKNGATTLYFFYGDPAFGKNRLGLYKQKAYRVVVNEEKDPPTARVINENGQFKEVLVQMTAAQWELAKGCFAK
ncbi:MAG TPA: hypothetical protein VGS58_07685 [Candidatus Sulfopaludibacter sp.]|nr:hypothetical protein [Candidatus Sulfopaludibacter sp.]